MRFGQVCGRSVIIKLFDSKLLGVNITKSNMNEDKFTKGGEEDSYNNSSIVNSS